MNTRALWHRMAGLATVLGLSVVVPFVTGVTPAHAQAQLRITKTHEGDFARGEQGVYRITVSNPGSEATRRIFVSDELPGGLRAAGVQAGAPFSCSIVGSMTVLTCSADALGAGQTATILLTVNVPEDAPCSVTNRVTVSEDGTLPNPILPETDSDVTAITGGECGNGNGGDGDGDDSGSILPITLNGVIPMFNNIATTTNIESPNATNHTSQDFALTAP
ncbi:DUF11 domain-containing protein [Streptomyces antimicrobicus]|uniref:DUF11 domain-containing protein n=1 Tax=Streptomyces antimicrobicus TaxID=2883108 RepID=A0ABS8B6H5_9ACTN|nr:DUF11 domain-containing protein [Streptomyces antimicrobicus]MCB5180187.1 DUF11 domain-containing protein [Streptomyces antimicrobicus]